MVIFHLAWRNGNISSGMEKQQYLIWHGETVISHLAWRNGNISYGMDQNLTQGTKPIYHFNTSHTKQCISYSAGDQNMLNTSLDFCPRSAYVWSWRTVKHQFSYLNIKFKTGKLSEWNASALTENTVNIRSHNKVSVFIYCVIYVYLFEPNSKQIYPL